MRQALTLFSILILAIALFRPKGRLVENLVTDQRGLSPYEKVARSKGMVPLIEPGEYLVDYKKRALQYMYGQPDGKPPLFDKEYIHTRLDNQRKWQPLDQRKFYDEL